VIDLHTHILPGFDDGASSWEEAREMLLQAEEDGITDLVATPHILGPADLGREEEMGELFAQLKRIKEAERLKLRLHLGAEIYAHHEMRLDRPFLTLGGNRRYFLVEFPMDSVPPFAEEQFFALMLDGYVPIVAHPERNLAVVRNSAIVEALVERGVLLQVNSGSLRGVFGPETRRVAEQLVEARLVHVVASDAHGASARRPRLREAFALVSRKWGEETATRLFIDNPRHILAGENVEVVEPISLERVQATSLATRLKRLWRGGR
jgi:protein-tyrosine phosphatase